MRLAQCRRIRHRAQVAHHAPGASQRLGGGFQRFHGVGPGGFRGGVLGTVDGGLRGRQQDVQRRADVLGADL